ncbi:MAG: type transport system permease protein [Thermoleophilaceae bacterium]|nr:type transport system permease protein [Thermoleophilaceae bacterium]
MSTATLAWREFRFQRRMFWRNPSAAFFNFALPLIFLLLIASVFSLDQDALNHFVPGIAGMAVMSATFTALAFNMTFLREQGILKRIRGTPEPPLAYFGGVISNAVYNAFVQVTIIVVLGHLLYKVPWPRDWLEVVVITALGVTAFATLGIAMAQAIPNFDSAPAYVNAIFLPMIFISGTFYSTEHLPAVLAGIANALPLKHIIDGLYGALVTGAGLGHHVTAVVVLGLWCVAGLFLALRYFRWE